MATTQPVSAAFSVAAGPFGEMARSVLATIDRVHLVGPLPRIPIDDRVGALGADGSYRFQPRRGRAHGIGVDPAAPHPELTLLHEIGHFLDHQALGRPGSFASRRHPDLADWRRAVGATRCSQELRETRRLAALIGDPVHDFDYLLDVGERWARSYAQYVIAKSGDPALAQQIAATRRSDAPYRLAHWEADDFDAVVVTIDDLMRRKGWLR